MNTIAIATVEEVPDSGGFGAISMGGARRICYFDPQRFRAPDPLPILNERVFVAEGVPCPQALYMLGRIRAT